MSLERDGYTYTRIEDRLFADMDAAARLSLHVCKSRNHDGYTRHPGRTVLENGPFAADHPFIEFARTIQGEVAEYLRNPLLFAVQLNYSYPFATPAEGAYLWHRDGDDRSVVKCIVYFSNVDDTCGPFCYAPRTHPKGELARINPAGGHYRTDAEMAGIETLPLTGAAGTVIIADTAGFHRGLKPESGERLALFVTFTSQRPITRPLPVVIGEDRPKRTFWRTFF